MSKFATAMKEEMLRLGRKESKRVTAPLKARITALERTIRQQKRTMAQLARQAAQAVRTAGARATVAVGSAVEGDRDPSRLGARSIRSQRKRLKLSQKELALLVGVTPVAVYLWESGRTKPRAKARTALVGLRSMSKRDARARLDAMGAKPAARRGRPKGSKNRKKRTKRS